MASVELLHTCWLPDRGEPYKWFEGGFGGMDFFAKGFAAGTLYLYVHNTGSRPIRPEAFFVNDAPLEKLRQEREAHWWRLLPTPLPPGAAGEIGIRLAKTPDTAPLVRVALDDGSEIASRVALQAAPVRIETVGFSAGSDTVHLVVEANDRKRRRVERVWLDAQEVTRQCKVLDPYFHTGIAPIVLRLERPLRYGSYHVYRVQTSDGAIAACCVRTGDDWVPLGSYGYATYVEYARNGCNGHNSFAPLSKELLDLHARLAMKAVMIIGDRPPDDYMKGHPGLLAYSPMDEPDVGDYYEAKELPHVQRIGYLAMEMERRCQTYREVDPSKMTLLTVNLTYKPMNYYVYAPIADIVNPDCYPLTLGQDVKWVYEVVRTARRAAGPRPVTFTFQSCYEEPYDPLERAKKRYPRPPTPGEIHLMTLYAVAAGARGLFAYGHHTERTTSYLHRGSGEFPEVWRAIGEIYRQLGHIAPLVAIAHPTSLASADMPTVLVSALVAGEDALILVVLNKDYAQERHTLRVNPVTVQIRVPQLPWLTPRRAWLVKNSGFEPLPLRRASGEAVVTLQELDTARLVLVTQNQTTVQTLLQRYEAYVARVSEGLRQTQG
ncbi:MAG: hypothetical protein RMM08_05800 [Armatimonadota bacterium]|nr:hypothetical protein [bacterium]MDW8320857.1 hypothetical protein [Armatimonadota bacterium]